MNSTSKLSALSYTNKDFNAIYEELLEYTKKISYKWDPSSSDESDPGLILLKLASIIGDKNNYNIDKNILELMPASVTQLPAAMQLFDQCGYTMRYYNSAEGYVNLTIKTHLGEADPNDVYQYKIPQFTMFTDTDNSVVYTSTQALTVPVKTSISVPVIQGTITDYTINNDPLITIQNLDSRNRLYFTETNIAENGIFITTVDSNDPSITNYNLWKRVDNLYIYPRGTYCYKFGVSLDNSLCYIEFPEDIEILMGEGLNIKYILTDGLLGNVSTGRLNKFYADTKFTRVDRYGGNPEEVDAEADLVSIYNEFSILSGQDPESIDDAYINYRRTKDTFNTLVSLKDYNDYMVTNDMASNGFVCDRTNDIQRAYRIVTSSGSSTYVKTVVSETETNNTPDMNAFNLCVYAFKNVPTVSNVDQCRESFQLQDDTTTLFSNVSAKSLQHDFKGFEPKKILLLKNKYTVTASVIPKYILSLAEKNEVIYNIETALARYLNSSKMTFGHSLDIEGVQQCVLTADERIQTIIDFTSPSYKTYAVYKSEDGKFKELQVDNDSPNGGYVQTSVTQKEFEDNKLNENPVIYYIKKYDNTFEAYTGSYNYKTTYYTFDKDLEKLWNNFRVEIFAKNVLCGSTPLYADENEFVTGVHQTDISHVQNIEKIKTNTNIKFTPAENSPSSLVSNKLEKNETVLLTLPNFVTENNYSTYVKILYFFNSDNFTTKKRISMDSKYELRQYDDETKDDFIIFFWKETEASEYYTYVKYDGSQDSLSKYISPKQFSLPYEQDLTSSNLYLTDPNYSQNVENIKTFFRSLKAGKHNTKNLYSNYPLIATHKTYGDVRDVNVFLEKFLISDSKFQVLTGTRAIETLRINEIQLNNDINGCQYFYWILNNNNRTLFNKGEFSYTLSDGEYLLYTNDEKTALHYVGQGTLLQRGEVFADSAWEVDSLISLDTVLSQGIDSLSNKWQIIRKVEESDDHKNVGGFWATEQQQILIGPGNKIVLDDIDSQVECTISGESELPEKTVDLSCNASFTCGNTVYKQIKFMFNKRENSEGTDTVDLYYVKEDNESISVLNGFYVEIDENKTIFKYTIQDMYSKLVLSNTSYDIIKEFFKNIGLSTSIDKQIYDQEFILDSSGAPLKGFEISYIDESNNVQNVSNIESDVLSWYARSILNLNMSSDVYQELLPHQDIKYKQVGETSFTSIKSEDNNNNTLVLSNVPLNMVGGNDINVKGRYIDSSGTDKGVSLFRYKTNNSDEDVLVYQNNGTIALSVPKIQTELQLLSLTFNVLPGNYLLELDTFDGFNIACDETTGNALVAVLDTSENNILTEVRKFAVYKFTVTDESKLTLEISYKTSKDDAILQIPPLFRYSAENLSNIRYGGKNNLFEDDLISLIGSKLDTKNEFSYTYRPKNYIENPLVASSFFKPDHFYNKFTICEWDTAVDKNIVVHDVIR